MRNARKDEVSPLVDDDGNHDGRQEEPWLYVGGAQDSYDYHGTGNSNDNNPDR